MFCYIFPVLPGSMFLKTVCLSCLANFFHDCYAFCLLRVLRLKYIIYLSYGVFRFAVFIISFHIECGLFHDRSAYLGYCIMFSLTVVCSGHSHGLYNHPCCLSCCLGYGYSEFFLLSCDLLVKHFLPYLV